MYEKILLAIILYTTFLFIHRAFAPWSDGDEIIVYGPMTKLIANGFSYSNSDIRIGWPKFAESLYAYFYFVSESTIFPKIIKNFQRRYRQNRVDGVLDSETLKISEILSKKSNIA